jgi:hypothetical protein
LLRDDLTNTIPALIQLAEAKMARDVRRKTLRATLTISDFATDLSALTNFGELRSINLVTSDESLDTPIHIGSMEQLAEQRARMITPGRPKFAAVVDQELLVGPTPDDSYDAQVTYYEALVPLSASQTTNSLLTEAPDLYVWATLLMAAPFLEHDERIPTWLNYYNDAVAGLANKRDQEEFAASLRPIRLPIVFG